MNSEYFQRWYRHAGPCQSTRVSDRAQRRSTESLLSPWEYYQHKAFLLELSLKAHSNSNGHFKTLCYSGYKGACEIGDNL